jgi:hypothetical protein
MFENWRCNLKGKIRGLSSKQIPGCGSQYWRPTPGFDEPTKTQSIHFEDITYM